METTIISPNLILLIKTIILLVALYVAYKLGKLAKEEELKQKKFKDLMEELDESIIAIITKGSIDWNFKNKQTDLIKNHGKTVKVVRNTKGRFAKKIDK